MIDPDTIRTAANILSIVDLVPIGYVPGVGQYVGEAIDVAAVLVTQSVLVADRGIDRITWAQYYIATGLNVGNFIIGTAGNVLSGPANIVLSFIEGGLLYLQYRVTEPCD